MGLLGPIADVRGKRERKTEEVGPGKAKDVKESMDGSDKEERKEKEAFILLH